MPSFPGKDKIQTQLGKTRSSHEYSRFPKALIEYHPRGRRRPGRPLKRLLDSVQIETETGHMGLIS
jgi:hypothetical protein